MFSITLETLVKAQGLSGLLPPQTRNTGASGDPGSPAGLPIHAKNGREWGPENAGSLTPFEMTAFKNDMFTKNPNCTAAGLFRKR